MLAHTSASVDRSRPSRAILDQSTTRKTTRARLSAAETVRSTGTPGPVIS